MKSTVLGKVMAVSNVDSEIKKNTYRSKVGVGKMFCSPRLHLFYEKYRKNSKIVKYYYYFK